MIDAVMQQLGDNGAFWARGAAALIVLGLALLLSSVAATLISRARRRSGVGQHLDILDELSTGAAGGVAHAVVDASDSCDPVDEQLSELVDDLGRRLDRLETQLDALAARAEGTRPRPVDGALWSAADFANRRESAEAAQLRLAAHR